MELDKTYVGLYRRKGRAVSQVTLEEDLNVPDQKPDIFRIIHRQGEFRPDEVKGESGKVKVRGVFLYRILYIGETMERKPEVLEGSIPVDEIVFVNELEEGDGVDFSWELEDLHASAIHSRKANIKCVLALTAEGYREQSAAMLEKPEDQEGLYLRTCPVKLQQEAVHKKDTLRIKEELNLPPGKPNIRRILWREMRLQGTEARPGDGMLQVKGELAVFFLYECEEDGGQLQWVEQVIPFRQEVACEECREDLFGKAEIRLGRAELEMQADYDGEPRMVRIDAVAELLLRYFLEQPREILCDAYSLEAEITPQFREYDWDNIKAVADSRTRVSGRWKIPEDAPQAIQILCSGAVPHVDYSSPQENAVLIQGTLELWALYATEDDGQPIACSMGSIPFEHTVELQELRAAGAYQITVCLDQLTVGLLDSAELEAKATLQLQVLYQEPEQFVVVEELQEQPLDLSRLKKMPGMVIHVAQPGESLWDIAKAHATTCRAVMELNELKDEELKEGQKLLLVKEFQGTGTSA